MLKKSLMYQHNENFIYGFDIRFGVARPCWIKKSAIIMIEPYTMETDDQCFHGAFDNYKEFENSTCSSVQVRSKWYLVATFPQEIIEDLG